MAVDDPNTIDIVSTRANGDVVLTISDHLEWDDTDEHLLTLQAKINAYLRFVESGEIFEAYPNSQGHPISIEVVFQRFPNPVGLKFLDMAKEIVNGAGIGFRFEVWRNSN